MIVLHTKICVLKEKQKEDCKHVHEDKNLVTLNIQNMKNCLYGKHTQFVNDLTCYFRF